MTARSAPDLPVRLPRSVFISLGLLQAAWPLTMDLYLPAFPSIGRDLAASPSLVQLTLTSAFIGMAMGQLATGPLSDAVGRVPPLLAALGIYTLASACCAAAPTAGVLVGARLVQGMGGSALTVTALAMVRDSTSGPGMVRVLARLQLINGVFVVGAPALGALLLLVIDWRGLFAVLTAYGLVLLVLGVVVLRPAGSRSPRHRSRTGSAALVDDYRALFRDRDFVRLLITSALVWGAMMSYMSASAFLWQGVYGLTPTMYAVVFGGHGALMILGSQAGAMAAARHGAHWVVRRGTLGLCVVATILVASVAGLPQLGVLGFLVPLVTFTTLFGVMSPSVQAAALQHHGLRSGTAASLLGAANMVVGASISPLVGAIGVESALPAALIMLACTVLASGVALAGRRGAAAAGVDSVRGPAS